ncbi:thaumatin-like protein 1b [Malania oleifera]|uniref:thaumatin-like protein 1b n=1 Tax=Malania oleifera TaxID=397392 RepID=UPI0025AEAC4A|nr:thaumatin-like protein 1b [Malania oleifera]
MHCLPPALLSLILLTICSGAVSTTFTIVNKCNHPVWPGLLSGAGTPQLPTTGFLLQAGESKTIPVPPHWSGNMWGRTLCATDSAGKFSCTTADCGSGTLECAGRGPKPPASLVEFTLDGAGGLDFFDVSLVDGFNLPVLITPHGGTGVNCTATGCEENLNEGCPSELRAAEPDGQSVGCRSACDAFGGEQYCCSGAFNSPQICKPTKYSLYFKSACPSAYSYAYDDATSTFTCSDADYVIAFCPSPHGSEKSGQSPNMAPLSGESFASSNS